MLHQLALPPGLIAEAAALSRAQPDRVRRWYPLEDGEEMLAVWRPGRTFSLLTGTVNIAAVTTWG